MDPENAAFDLPIWMRKARRGVDWGILITIALALLSTWPFLLQPGLPRTNASERYVYRAVLESQALREGRLYPRWTATAFGGYGAPISHYAPPGATYTAAVISAILTGDPVSATRGVFVLSSLVSGAACYALVLRRTNARAAVVAATLYLLCPHIVLTTPHILGDLPSVMGFALLPALLWSTDRLLRRREPIDLILVTLTMAGLFLTHIGCALTGAALATGFAMMTRTEAGVWRRFGQICVAVILAAGLSAFFWLPAAVEHSLVRWQLNGEAIPPTFDLARLFLPPPIVDLNELFMLPISSVGPAIGLASAAGLINGARRRRLHIDAIFFLSAGISFTTAAAVLTDQAWLVGVTAFCLSIGGSIALFGEDMPSAPALPAILAVIWLLSLPGLFTPRWPTVFGETNMAAQVLFEQQGFGIATSPAGALVPTALVEGVEPNQRLIISHSTGIVNKLATEIGPSRLVQIGILAHETHRDRFQIQTLEPLTIRLLTAAFPGWQALLNDAAVPTSRDEATGFLEISLPSPSAGELVVQLGPTPIRSLAWVLSAAAIVMLGGLSVRMRRSGSEVYEELNLLNAPEARTTGILLIGLSAAFILLTSPLMGIGLHAPAGHRLAGSQPLRWTSESGLEALAYRIERQAYRPGETAHFTLYWRAQRPLTVNYRLRAHLLSLQTGAAIGHTADRLAAYYPARRWTPNYFVTDRIEIPIPPTAAPGEYAFALELLNCINSCEQAPRLRFFDRNGAPIGGTLVIPVVITLDH
ncbi:MAG: 6-pyruvoyl-tetrahydropterin synthase-related protein [Aggregatilineales bacterium]